MNEKTIAIVVYFSQVDILYFEVFFEIIVNFIIRNYLKITCPPCKSKAIAGGKILN